MVGVLFETPLKDPGTWHDLYTVDIFFLYALRKRYIRSSEYDDGGF